MKRRVRNQPTNPFYSNEPAVAKNLMADNPAVQNSSLATKTPKTVDKKPGRLSGLANFESKSRPPVKKLSPVSGKTPTAAKVPSQGGHLRMSGNPGAHRLGGVKPIKLKV